MKIRHKYVNFINLIFIGIDQLGYWLGFIAQQKRRSLLEMTVIGLSTINNQSMISCQYVYHSFPNWYDPNIGHCSSIVLRSSHKSSKKFQTLFSNEVEACIDIFVQQLKRLQNYKKWDFMFITKTLLLLIHPSFLVNDLVLEGFWTPGGFVSRDRNDVL